MSTPEQKDADSTMQTSLLHSGLSGSFLRPPHVPPDAEHLTAVGAGAASYGIPWGSTVIGRSSVSYGRRGIREASLRGLGYNATLNIDLVDALNPVDRGDAPTTLANAEKTFET